MAQDSAEARIQNTAATVASVQTFIANAKTNPKR